MASPRRSSASSSSSFSLFAEADVPRHSTLLLPLNDPSPGSIPHRTNLSRPVFQEQSAQPVTGEWDDWESYAEVLAVPSFDAHVPEDSRDHDAFVGLLKDTEDREARQRQRLPRRLLSQRDLAAEVAQELYARHDTTLARQNWMLLRNGVDEKHQEMRVVTEALQQKQGEYEAFMVAHEKKERLLRVRHEDLRQNMYKFHRWLQRIQLKHTRATTQIAEMSKASKLMDEEIEAKKIQLQSLIEESTAKQAAIASHKKFKEYMMAVAFAYTGSEEDAPSMIERYNQHKSLHATFTERSRITEQESRQIREDLAALHQGGNYEQMRGATSLLTLRDELERKKMTTSIIHRGVDESLLTYNENLVKLFGILESIRQLKDRCARIRKQGVRRVIGEGPEFQASRDATMLQDTAKAAQRAGQDLQEIQIALATLRDIAELSIYELEQFPEGEDGERY